METPAGTRPAVPERVGLIGIGLMGLAIAERLSGDVRLLVGWDIGARQRAAFSRLGGAVADGGAEVMHACDRVLFSLPDPDVVADVLRQAGGSLRRGQIIMDTSTGDPRQVAELGRNLARKGLTYLDATVSGSSAQVRRGEVVLMVGGPKKAFDRCQDLFRLFSREAIHTGPCGSGARMKLVTNLVLGLNRVALAEGLTFARALGLGGDPALRVLRASMAYSRIMDTKGEKMLNGDFEPQAKLSQHLKDVKLILATAAKAGAKLPLSQTHRELLELAERAGLGELDNSAVIRVMEGLKNLRS
ncbi:MAG: NAD(P)-dependent oxidoreductase [Verrucomicrobia bacterium]|nr:NAD(P)-dependent oxidoreductase [Verrucomicrobiota bacterium]